MPTEQCDRCGGPMLALFTSKVCRNNCANIPTDQLIRTHRMVLPDGWLLWTDDETPPTGWTHVRTEYVDKGARRNTSPAARPHVEAPAGHFAWSAPEWRGFVMCGEGRSFRLWSSTLPGRSDFLREGLAYKVP